jgi:hypothetical protein
MPRSGHKPRILGNAGYLSRSWTFESWPPDVFPHDAEKARYFYRTHKDELAAERVVSRHGRTLVFSDAAFAKYLAKRAARVAGYLPPPNRRRIEPREGEVAS